MGLWVAAVVVETLMPDKQWAEQVVMVAGSMTIVVLLGFAVLVVRDPEAVSTQEPYGPITAAVQAMLALMIWVLSGLITSLAVVTAEPDRAFGLYGSGIRAVIWQSANTVPILNIPETVGWDNPLSDAASYVGWHMVLARAAFVISVLTISKAIYEQHILIKSGRLPSKRVSQLSDEQMPDLSVGDPGVPQVGEER